MTALPGAVVLRMRLTRLEVAGVAAVIAGLVHLGLSATEDRPVDASAAQEWGVLGVALLLGALAVPLARVTARAGPALLGMVAGLALGAVAVAARIHPEPLTVSGPLPNPAPRALVVAGGVALLS